MVKRIKNSEQITSHGSISGRKALVEILEAGLQGADPYHNTKKLIQLKDNRLIVGGEKYEPKGSPISGYEQINLEEVDNIYFFGACKGIQRVAKAVEDVLGTRLTGGHVIDKKGHPIILEKIGVTLGGHPVPDEDCVAGCQRIFEMMNQLTEKDIVFTCVGNGASSLLTMPAQGISLDDIKNTTYIMQIELGVPTPDLNPIRNHLDLMKGGRISRYIQPARAIHFITIEPGSYDQLINRNLWLHTLPDRTTFKDALRCLQKWEALEKIPPSVRKFIEEANPQYESVKADEFLKTQHRIFGIMPGFRQTAKLAPAINKAKQLGFRPVLLSELLFQIEAREAGKFFAAICKTIEHSGKPFKPPCALFSSGEMVVTVGNESGVGGRNQEFSLSAAKYISGSENIIIGSVDTDGTDGPGTQFSQEIQGMPTCLAGGIVDGDTIHEADAKGLDTEEALRKHNASPILWKLGCGIETTPGISLVDLTVGIVMARSPKEEHLYY